MQWALPVNRCLQAPRKITIIPSLLWEENFQKGWRLWHLDLVAWDAQAAGPHSWPGSYLLELQKEDILWYLKRSIRKCSSPKLSWGTSIINRSFQHQEKHCFSVEEYSNTKSYAVRFSHKLGCQCRGFLILCHMQLNPNHPTERNFCLVAFDIFKGCL